MCSGFSLVGRSETRADLNLRDQGYVTVRRGLGVSGTRVLKKTGDVVELARIVAEGKSSRADSVIANHSLLWVQQTGLLSSVPEKTREPLNLLLQFLSASYSLGTRVARATDD